MHCVIIGPGNAYGPWDKFDYEKCHVTPASVRKVADALDPIPVWGDGSDIRDIIYIEDLIDGIVFVTEKIKSYDIVNICHGDAVSVIDILSMLKDIANSTAEIQHGINKAFMMTERRLSNKKAEKLGWKPSYTVYQGLTKTLEWYIDNKFRFNPDSRL